MFFLNSIPEKVPVDNYDSLKNEVSIYLYNLSSLLNSSGRATLQVDDIILVCE